MKRNMILLLRVLASVAVVTSVAVFVPWTLLLAWLAPLPDTVQEQLDDAVGHGLDGIIVYVDRADSEPETLTAGWKDRDARLPAEPGALFKIASINKLYIAVAAAKLVSEQMMSLDDTLADHLPQLAGRIEHADKITLKLMLKHRSGIPNFTDHPDFPWTNPPKTSGESLSFVLDEPAVFEPDSDYAYSNTNYLLVSEIIDKALGYAHQRYIKAEILRPLGLANTFESMEYVDKRDMMSGYSVGYDADIKNNDFGSMIATAEDVGIFLRALNDGSLLDDDEQAIYSSVYGFEHTGLLPGYSSIARYHADIDAVVVQFVNTSGGDTWALTEIVYGRIVDILRAVPSGSVMTGPAE